MQLLGRSRYLGLALTGVGSLGRAYIHDCYRVSRLLFTLALTSIIKFKFTLLLVTVFDVHSTLFAIVEASHIATDKKLYYYRTPFGSRTSTITRKADAFPYSVTSAQIISTAYMLRRPATTITLTSADVEAYEANRQRKLYERQQAQLAQSSNGRDNGRDRNQRAEVQSQQRSQKERILGGQSRQGN